MKPFSAPTSFATSSPEFVTSWRPIGRYEEELRKAKTIAIDEMCEFASELGCNSVIGVDLDYESIQMGSGGGMLMVSASGTAVVLE